MSESSTRKGRRDISPASLPSVLVVGGSDIDEEQRRKRARVIAEERYGFFWHLGMYALVNVGLVGIWFFTGSDFFWPIFPMAIWGIFLVGHYVSAFRAPGRGWVDRETERILRKEEEKINR